MYAVSFYTLKNGVKVLSWINSSKLKTVYHMARNAVKAGGIDVCLEMKDGSFIPLN